MKVEILGAGGGLGSGSGTSAILVGQNTLLDAGSGVEGLSLERARAIRHVFLTHAHMDHISGLPLLVETVFDQKTFYPLTVHGLPDVLQILREHLFNGRIWPDFGRIPDPTAPVLRWSPLTDAGIRIDEDFLVTAFPTQHDVPSCGFCLRSKAGRSFVATGDTGYDDALVASLNALGPINVLLTECSLPNRLSDSAERFFHLTPDLVARMLAGLKHPPGEVWLSHLKPSVKEEIPLEVSGTPLRIVEPGQVWEL